MSIALSLKPRVLRTYDADAAAYISAVEAADNQTLESGIKEAITEFVIGCKIRGIWDAIKSCCLLCGARTMAGATIPLKGNAPALTSFVGNYNRETGLIRTSGTFSINRNNNTDPQNNKHVAVYPNRIEFGANDSIFRSLLANNTTSGSTFFAVNSVGINIRVNTSANIVTNQPIISGNLIGVSVLNSSQSQLLYNNQVNIISITTTTPSSGDLTLFGGGGVSASTGSRIAFYSVGESLNLRLLNDLVTQLRGNILKSLSTFQATDSDALDYIKRVEAADNFILESTVKQAIDSLVIGLKADSLWSSIKACCLLSGAKTLSGALTPLVGPIPQSFAFTNAHYNRSLGLVGVFDGFRYINSRRRGNSDPQNNHHMCIYRTSSANINVCIGSTTLGSSNGDALGSTGQNAGTLWSKSRTLNSVTTSNYNSGSNVLIGIARNNADNYEIIGNNLTTTINAVSNAPSSNNIYVFSGANTSNQGGGINSNTDARISYYSIGEYLNLSLLDARLDTFMAALSNAGI